MSRDYEVLVMDARVLFAELERLANAVELLADDQLARMAAVARAREVLREVANQIAASRRRRGGSPRDLAS